MKRLLLILFIFLGFCCAVNAQEEDSRRYAGLDSLLTQFYRALERESVEVKNAEFDSLIAMVDDSLARQHVTLRVLNHYMHARVI